MRHPGKLALFIILAMASVSGHAQECFKPEVPVFTSGDIRLIAGIKAKMIERGASSRYLRSVFPQLEIRARDRHFVRNMNQAMTADLIADKPNILMSLLTPGQLARYRQAARSADEKYQQCKKQEEKLKQAMEMPVSEPEA